MPGHIEGMIAFWTHHVEVARAWLGKVQDPDRTSAIVSDILH